MVLDVAQVQEALLYPKPVDGILVQQGLVYLHFLLVGVIRRGSSSGSLNTHSGADDLELVEHLAHQDAGPLGG